MAIKEHYFEILDVLDGLFFYIFEGLNARYSIELTTISQQYPFEPLKYLPLGKTLRLTFQEGVQMLKEAGIEQVRFQFDRIFI